MARCKCCNKKSFMLETDVNGLCAECAPYYNLSLSDDLEELEKTIKALSRINNPLAAAGRIETAGKCLDRLRPYVKANLVNLPVPLPELENMLSDMEEQLADDLSGET